MKKNFHLVNEEGELIAKLMRGYVRVFFSVSIGGDNWKFTPGFGYSEKFFHEVIIAFKCVAKIIIFVNWYE